MRSRRARCIAFLVLCAAGAARANDCERAPTCANGDAPWQQALRTTLSDFLACREASDDLSACNEFVARGLAAVYGVDDFRRAGGGYLSANEIADRVADANGPWVALGAATSQAALTEAQGQANAGRAVIAVHRGTPHGHVALILPGTAVKSKNWGTTAPCSASFRLENANAAFVGCGLAWAFGDPTDVLLYGHGTARPVR